MGMENIDVKWISLPFKKLNFIYICNYFKFGLNVFWVWLEWSWFSSSQPFFMLQRFAFVAKCVDNIAVF